MCVFYHIVCVCVVCVVSYSQDQMHHGMRREHMALLSDVIVAMEIKKLRTPLSSLCTF